VSATSHFLPWPRHPPSESDPSQPATHRGAGSPIERVHLPQRRERLLRACAIKARATAPVTVVGPCRPRSRRRRMGLDGDGTWVNAGSRAAVQGLLPQGSAPTDRRRDFEKVPGFWEMTGPKSARSTPASVVAVVRRSGVRGDRAAPSALRRCRASARCGASGISQAWADQKAWARNIMSSAQPWCRHPAQPRAHLQRRNGNERVQVMAEKPLPPGARHPPHRLPTADANRPQGWALAHRHDRLRAGRQLRPCGGEW